MRRSWGGFTSHAEMLVYVEGLKSRARNLHVTQLGLSRGALEIPMLVFTTAPSADAAAVRATGKPTVWVHAQQHGDEPASGEAALALADELAGGLAHLLERINVVIVPRVNVDGAIHNRRGDAGNFDLNRDAMRMRLAESRALRRANLAYAPVLTIDAHEYSPQRPGAAQRGLLEAHDLLLQGPENLNVPQAIRDLSENLFVAAAKRAALAEGLRVHTYYYVASWRAGSPLVLTTGGDEARIGRNFHGLANQASVLLESRGIGMGRQAFRRRVWSQLVAMRAMLEAAAEHADTVRAIVGGAEAAVVASGRGLGAPMPVAVRAQRSEREGYRLPYIDVASNEIVWEEVRLRSWESPTVLLGRTRPKAYVISPGEIAATEILRELGVRHEITGAPIDAPCEQYIVTRERRDTNFYEGVQRRTLTTRIGPPAGPLPAGSIVVPMDQPLANFAVALLEPEGADSLASFGVFDAREGDPLPVCRIPLGSGG